MLQEEFGERVSYIDFKGPRIRYSSGESQVWKIASQLPSILWWFFREKRFTKKLVAEHNPDMIISDNRYGMRSKEVFSVFVTHQLQIHLPAPVKWLEIWINQINHRVIRPFDLCMVPDFKETPGLSGKLGHSLYHGPLIYSGPLSRFAIPGNISDEKPMECLPEDFVLVLLSGPEPQRTLLEEKLQIQLKNTFTVWFRGLPGQWEPAISNKYVIFDHGSSALIGWFMRHAKLVICRSGYSSVMDLAVFGKNALMIPTPGQTEQEYLAKHLQEAGFVRFISQDKLKNIHTEMKEVLKSTGLPQNTSGHEQVIRIARELLDKMRKRKNGNTGK
jgi:hypothetical protein